jgi:hypothetical protein
MFTDEVRQIIIRETKGKIHNLDMDNLISCFEKVLLINCDFPEVADIGRVLFHAVPSFYTEAQSHDERCQAFTALMRMEPYLEKLLYIVNYNKYITLVSNPKHYGEVDLFPVMNALGLFDSVKDLNGIAPIRENPDKYKDSKTYVDHFIRAYQSRNTEFHAAKELDTGELHTRAQSAMITFMITAWQYKSKIEAAYSHHEKKLAFDTRPYLTDIISAYDKRVKEGFSFVPIKWVCKNPISPDGSNISTMDTLRSDMQGVSHAMLTGEAGTGKSTSIEYLTYSDAKKCWSNSDNPIPITVRLIDISESFLSIEDEIGKRLGISNKDCERLLVNGALNVYIDGINELSVAEVLKKRVIRAIEKFISTYKNCFIIITDRRSTINSPITIYSLKSMDEYDVAAFLSKQLKPSDPLLSKLLEYFGNVSLSRISCTPLMLNMTITVSKTINEIPESVDELVEAYLSALIQRELREKREPLADMGKIEALLKHLALRASETSEECVSQEQAMLAFKKCSEYLGFVVDTADCLDLAIQLGILKRSNNLISFANDIFLTNYLSLALKQDMEQWDV